MYQKKSITLKSIGFTIVFALVFMCVPLHAAVYYVDEWADAGSVLMHLLKGRNCLGDLLDLMGRKKAYRYADRRDMRVFFSSCLRLAEVGWERLSRRNGNGGHP